MSNTSGTLAVFPGSFDPFTNGHADIVERGLHIFGRIVVAVAESPKPAALFSVGERLNLIREVCRPWQDQVEVDSFSGLLVDYLRSRRTTVILRGLRAVSDYDYELQMALMNKALWQQVETCFLAARELNSFISSSLAKQVSAAGGDVSMLVPANVAAALQAKFSGKIS